jgi:hypothetical protein
MEDFANESQVAQSVFIVVGVKDVDQDLCNLQTEVHGLHDGGKRSKDESWRRRLRDDSDASNNRS